MDLNNYFKDLAIEHVEINHTEENKAFFREYASARILLDTDFHKNLRHLQSSVVLISQFNEDAQLPEPANDFSRQKPTGTLYILARITGTDTETARLKAIEVRDDIYAKIKTDIRGAGVFPRSFKFEQISSGTIGRIADNFYGIAINISYTDRYVPAHNQAKWNDIVS